LIVKNKAAFFAYRIRKPIVWETDHPERTADFFPGGAFYLVFDTTVFVGRDGAYNFSDQVCAFTFLDLLRAAPTRGRKVFSAYHLFDTGGREFSKSCFPILK